MPYEIIFHTDLIAFAHTISFGLKSEIDLLDESASLWDTQWPILGNIKMPNQSTKHLAGSVLNYGTQHREYQTRHKILQHMDSY